MHPIGGQAWPERRAIGSRRAGNRPHRQSGSKPIRILADAQFAAKAGNAVCVIAGKFDAIGRFAVIGLLRCRNQRDLMMK